jgi:hypothetical protein
MKPVSFGATTAASAAAKGATAATKAAGAAGAAPPPPPPRRSAGAGTQAAGKTAPKKEADKKEMAATATATTAAPMAGTEGMQLRERYDRAALADVEDIQSRDPGRLVTSATTRQNAAERLAMQPEGYSPYGWQRMADLALGPEKADALRYAIGSRVPELLGGGTPRGTEKLNLGGTPESEMVVYPRGVTRGLAATAKTPREFMERVWQLRADFKPAKQEFAQAKREAIQARSNPNASMEDVQRADSLARSRLQRVVDLREMLRNTGESEDSLSIE